MSSSPIEPTGPHYSTFPVDPELRLASGCRIQAGRWEIVEELARGGMGIVYRARETSDPAREVAIKVVTVGADLSLTAARFRNEARLGSSLAGDPYIVAPLYVGRLDGPVGFEGRDFLVTELVTGPALDELMRGHRTGLGFERACGLARDVARALQTLHGRGIVHRDVKPANVLVTGGDGSERARLIDFGLAYATGDGWETKSPDLTEEGQAPGTPLYMSPQQATHEQPSPAFDIYAFGVTLYELLSGNPPYEGVPLGVLMGRKCDPRERPFPISRMRPDLPAELAQLVDRCLAYDPRGRPSASQCAAVLGGVLSSGGVGAELRLVPPLAVAAPQPAVSADPPAFEARDPRVSEPPVVVAVGAQRRRHRLWIGGALALAFALAAGALAWVSRDTGPQTEAVRGATVVAPSAPQRDPSLSPELDAGGPLAEAAPAAPKMAPNPSEEHAAAPAEIADAQAELPETAPVADQPAASPEAAPIHPKHPVHPKRPPKSPTEASTAKVTCSQRRDKARKSEAAGRWSQVLEHTDDPACWSGATGLRERLRVSALMRLGRHKACAREAARSKDPVAAKWGQDCFRLAAGGTAATDTTRPSE